MDLRQYYGLPPEKLRELPLEVLEALGRGIYDGSVFPDGIPLRVEADRRRCLDSPHYLATAVLDPYYAKHYTEIHRRVMDEVLGPYLLGSTVRLQGSNYDPTQYTGLLMLMSRTTFKSTMLRQMVMWNAVYRKLKLTEDARTMFVHRNLDKATEHSEAIRQIARFCEPWRETFPEFRANPEGDWDWKTKWRWPNFKNYQATEWSFVAYGESSSKVGGHYTSRFVDDWVDDESVTTDAQLESSFHNFVSMDHLRLRDRPFNPWLAAGTHYHYRDCYKRLEESGGWLVLKVPAHTGSPKVIFDLGSIEAKSEEGRLKIEAGLRRIEANPPGELFFPELLSWRELHRSLRATSPRLYNCQLLLNPVPEGEQRFDVAALEASWVSDVPPAPEMWVYVRCDPAISEKRDADETAIVVGGVTWDGKRWFLDGWMGREKRPSEIVRKLFEFARRWQARGYPVRNIGIESVAYQEALAEMCRAGVPEHEVEGHGERVRMILKPCAIRSITRSPNMRKHERILEMDGPVTRREVRFYDKNPIGRKLMQQFTNFPFDRFDGLDAAHDMWDGCMAPPAQIESREPVFPREFEKLFARRKRKDMGTVQHVQLASW